MNKKGSVKSYVLEGVTNFVKGRAGVANMYSMMVALVENLEKSDITGKIGYIKTSGDKGAILTSGGWSLCFTNYTINDNKNLAFQCLKYLTSLGIQVMIALEHANGSTRKDILLPTENSKFIPTKANKDPPVSLYMEYELRK